MAVSEADIITAFGLPPRRAVEYFESKGNSVSWDWYETWQHAHNKAFTVAKAMKAEVLQDIRSAVGEVFKQGQTYEEFRRALEPKLKAAGWWGRQTIAGPFGEETVTLGSPWRLKRIYQTNVTTSYSAGRWQQFLENAASRPYLQYLATLDAKTRPTHRALHEKVFRINDPIWKYIYPPNDWGCRCRVRALNDADLGRLGLSVEDGLQSITFEDRLVSSKTGEVKPVAVYTDPVTGKRMATGVGWAYNPGMQDFEPDLNRLDKDIQAAFKADVKAAGLTQRYPVSTYGDIEKLLKAYDKENPGIFLNGFRSLRVTDGPYIMATDQGGGILLSRRPSSTGFNGAAYLRQALRKVSVDEPLDYDHEYAIEGLWHEICHNKMKGWQDLPNNSLSHDVMETLNQWAARHTYPSFLEALGGEAKHQAKILAEGVGYKRYVSNWRSLISALNIDEQIALGVIEPLVFAEKWSALPKTVASHLAKLSGKSEAQVLQAMGGLRLPSEAYPDWAKSLFKREEG